MTSDETEEVEVGEADEAEGAEMAEVAEMADVDAAVDVDGDVDVDADSDELDDVDDMDEELDWIELDDELDEDDPDDEDEVGGVEAEVDERVEEVEAEADEADEADEAGGAGGAADADADDEDADEDEILLTEDDALMEDDESGWLADPDVEGQERFWDGTEWTDHVRPVEEEPDFQSRSHLPDHVPELQRALAAATADIDDVEARLSTLFDRGEGKRARGAAQPSGARPADGPPIHEEFGGSNSIHPGDDPIHTGVDGAGLLSGDDDDAFAELDAALAAEEPEKRERRFFKRRS